jgi:spore germination protein YaaH
VDIDWEHWPDASKVDTLVNKQITALFKELHAALTPHNIWISYDVYASDWYGKHYPTELINYADEMVIMAFDGAGVWSEIGHHSPTSLAHSSYAYWLDRIGADNKDKLSIAIPFYGYNFQNDHTAGNTTTAEGIGYNETLAEHPDAYLSDTLKTETSICIHNGTKTLEEKLDFVKANKLKGVVIWELSFDQGTREKSLLDYIHERLSGETD